MPGVISIHAVDVTRGVPAAGMRVEVYQLDGQHVQIEGLLDAGGAVRGPGVYEVVFDVGAFYREQGSHSPNRPSSTWFGVADPAQHYHLPLKLSPWGFSLFRGA